MIAGTSKLVRGQTIMARPNSYLGAVDFRSLEFIDPVPMGWAQRIGWPCLYESNIRFRSFQGRRSNSGATGTPKMVSLDGIALRGMSLPWRAFLCRGLKP